MRCETTQIFQYADPALFLNEALAEKKRRNSKFSLRAWARSLGLREPTPLSQILKGKRPIPAHYLPKLGASLELDPKEMKYFEAIVGARYHKDPDQRRSHFKKAQLLAKRASFRTETLPDFKLLEDPLSPILLELVNIKGFRMDPEWIRARVGLDITVERIQKTYDHLLRKGLLRKGAEGELQKTHQHLKSRSDVSSLWIKQFHETSLKRAARAIYTQGLDEREFSSSVLSIRKQDLAEIKLAIRAFSSDLIARYCSSVQEVDTIYHLNINMIGCLSDAAQTPAGKLKS